MSLLCTRNQVRYGLWTQKMVLKNFLKLFFKKIWKFQKLALPLHPRSMINEQRMVLEKKFKIFFKKIWKFGKVAVPLQPLSASKIGERNKDIKQTSVSR